MSNIIVRLFFRPTIQSDLINKFNPTSTSSTQIFKKIITYFTFSSAQIQEQINKATQVEFEKSLDSLLQSENASYKELLETAFRIVSCRQLKQIYQAPDPKTIADDEAVYLTSLPTTATSIAHSINNHVYIYALLVKDFLVFVSKVPAIFAIGLFQVVLHVMQERPQIYSGLFDSYQNSKPQGERIFNHLIGNPLTSLMSMGDYSYSRLQWLWKKYLSHFEPSMDQNSTQFSKPFLRLLFGSFLFYLLYYFLLLPRLTVDAPQKLNTGKFYQNLNESIRLGEIGPGLERVVEKELLSNALLPIPGLDVNIVFITGDSGVGKTQLVYDLTWTCVYDKTSPHYEKTVFSINCADLVSREIADDVRNLLCSISGKEDKVIVFFDEAHNITDNNSGPSLIELCKTHFIENDIPCIMATTTKEYNDQIASNGAFVSRTAPIELKQLGDEETKDILRQKVMKIGLDMTPKAYDSILQVSQSHPTYQPRFNPRKSLQILKHIVTKALTWTPTTLSRELKTHQMTIRKLQAECQSKSRVDVHWSKSPAGKAKTQELKTAKTTEKETREKLEKQNGLYEEIKSIFKLRSEYENEKAKIVHQLSSLANPQTEKRFLFTKFVAVPAIERLLAKKLKVFEDETKQKLSVTIGKKFVAAQFPDVKLDKTTK